MSCRVKLGGELLKEERGLLLVFTGNGKGKTTAALGLALRAWGNDMKVLVLQFIKARKCGEHQAAERMGEGLTLKSLGSGFINFSDPEDMAKQRSLAKKALVEVKGAMTEGSYHMVILDEILYALKYGLVELEQVLELIHIRPGNIHLVLTGRDAPEQIISRADLVTEMKDIKHPFSQGVPAQRGIEF